MKLADSPFIKKVLGRVGDIGCPDYDGGFVFIHSQTDGPEIEWVEAPNCDWDCRACSGTGWLDECCKEFDLCYECNQEENAARCLACRGTGFNPSLRWTVYRALVERPDWIDLDDVSRSSGIEAETLKALLDSREPMALAQVFMMVGGHYGWYELDSEPLQLTKAEIEERYEDFDKLLKEKS